MIGILAATRAHQRMVVARYSRERGWGGGNRRWYAIPLTALVDRTQRRPNLDPCRVAAAVCCRKFVSVGAAGENFAWSLCGLDLHQLQSRIANEPVGAILMSRGVSVVNENSDWQHRFRTSVGVAETSRRERQDRNFDASKKLCQGTRFRGCT